MAIISRTTEPIQAKLHKELKGFELGLNKGTEPLPKENKNQN